MASVLVLGSGVAGPSAAQAPLTPAAASAPVSPETAEIQRLIKEGQHEKALKLIDESLVKNPRDPQMRFRRGVALSMLDRKAEALAVFQKLVDDHPDMPAPYNNMAVILGAQGDYEKARQSLEKAIRTNPAYATAYQNLGDVYAQLASQAYTKALQLDKADTSVQPKLALLRELTSGASVPPPLPAPGAAKSVAKAAQVAPPATAASPAAAPMVAAAPLPKAPAPAAPASMPGPKPAPAASAPAAPKTAAASPAAPAAPVATKPAPTPAAPNSASPEVEAAVRAWASAWSKRDLQAYYAAYTPEFRGQAASRKVWEQDRRVRIAPRKQIKVEVLDLKVTVEGDRATARFRQVYASDALSTTGRKTLQFVRRNGHWLIQQEAVGG